MKSVGQGFFHIDRRIWNSLCNQKDVNMAVAYLCVATGTGSGNRTSFWSAQAIEKYTGLHNSRATKAINELVATGFMCRSEKSSRTRPMYELQDYPNVLKAVQDAACEGHGGGVMTSVRKGQKLLKSDTAIAERLVTQTLLWRTGNGFTADPPSEDVPRAELIWLPNALVTGTSSGEASPVKKLRSRRDLWALRLLVDLYQTQNLSADGGISRSVLRYEYVKKKYGERGRHILWGFSAKQPWASLHSSTKCFWDRKAMEKLSENPIFPALQTLRDMGLLEVVPHLVENASNDCEPIHGFGRAGVGEDIERVLGEAADAAGRHMIGEERLYTAENEVDMLAPVWETLPDVQMVGVFRLTYRPQTRLTADWYRRMNEGATEWLETYRRLGPPARTLSHAAVEDWFPLPAVENW
jgi:hypothetical protein